MRIIIAGAGEVGVGIATSLSREGHDVVVVDRSASRVARVQEQADCLAIQGNGASPQVLDDAGAKGADMVIAVTDADEVNMITCLAAGYFGVETRIARIRNPDYLWRDEALLTDKLGIDLTINPEVTAAEEIRRLLLIRFASGISDFADGRLLLIRMQVTAGMPAVGQSLADIRMANKEHPFVVSAIERNGEVLVPSRGDIVIEAEDTLSVTVRREAHAQLAILTGHQAISPDRVIIGGVSRLALHVARLMKRDGLDVVLIDEDPEACDAASETLKATVLRGDSTDVRVLRDAGLDEMSAFVGASEDDENNLISATLAKRLGAMKTIATISKPGYAPLLASVVPVDAAISSRLSTVSAILRFVRRGRVITLVSVGDNQAEVLEMMAEEDCPAIGLPLRQIFYPGGTLFPQGSNICAIVRGDDVIVPTGDDVIRAGDRVIVSAERGVVPKIGRVLSTARRAFGLGG